jgi:hypothetical protein
VTARPPPDVLTAFLAGNRQFDSIQLTLPALMGSGTENDSSSHW